MGTPQDAQSESLREALAQVEALHRAGNDAEARSRIEALVAGLPAGLPDEDRFTALWAWADLRSHADAHEAAVEAYLACRPLLERLGKRRGLVVEANNRGYHLAMLGRRADAEAALREARESARLVGQPMLLRSYGALAHWQAEWGALDEAESAARVGVQQARTWADPAELGAALLTLARVLAKTPRTDRALLHYTEAVALLEPSGRPAAKEARRELEALQRVPPGAR